MECRLDKNKIKQGIDDAAIDMATATGLFTVNGNIISTINKVTQPELKPLTEEQISLINKALTYKDDIKGEYKNVFEEDPALFLYEISDQANSSEMEKNGALEAVGENIVEIAQKVYPVKIEKSVEEKAIDTINSSFTREVITRIGQNKWKIDSPDELAVMYMLSQPGAWPHITDYLRARYLSQFTPTSANLIGENLWLNHPALQDLSVQDMLNFMRKLNPNARVGEFDNLDRNGVAIIRDYTILIKRGAMIETLPHEVSHFFVELLPDDSELKKEMMQKIIDMPIYGDVYRKYKDSPSYQKNGKTDIDKIKREAITQQISEYIRLTYRNKAEQKYGKNRSWLQSIVHRFMKFLRKLFHKNSPPIYTEPLFDTTSPFVQAANKIIGGDISNLNIKKVPSVYDSIFFEEMENNIPELYEADDIVKSIYEFTKSIKKQIAKVFRVNVEDKKMQALIDELNDPNNKDYNRVFDIISRFGVAQDILKDILDTPRSNNSHLLVDMMRVSNYLGEAYHSMETIPEAIERTIKKMNKENNLDKLLDNITELQGYSTFAESFKTITTEFNSMLSYIRDKWPSETEGIDMYEKIVENMGNAQTKFDVANNHINDLLTTHLAKIMEKWTDSYLTKHMEDLKKRYNVATTAQVKKHFMEEMFGKLNDYTQFARALIGNFPKGKTEKIGNQKINIERLKDLSNKDMAIFLTSSPTLMADPFLSNAVAYFYDKYAEYQFRGQMEAKAFADSISPNMKNLADQGLNWYEANNMIQGTQSFYTPFSEDKEIIQRTLLSEVNNFNLHHYEEKSYADINVLNKQLSEMKKPESTATQAEIDAKQAEVDKAEKDFEEHMAKWSYRTYTDEFYVKMELLKASRDDSPVLKEMKEIKKKLLLKEEEQYGAFILDATFQNVRYDKISEEIAILQGKLIQLSDKLPDKEKDTFKLADELYEEDKVNSSRLRQAHRNKMIADVVKALIDSGNTAIYDENNVQIGTKSRAQLEEETAFKYDALYTITVPKQEFYDKRAELFTELSKLLGTNVEFKSMQERIDELSKKERRYAKQIRDFRGDANMSSLKYISVKNDNGIDVPLAQALKEMELEVDLLRKKISLYSQILHDVTTPQAKDNLIAFVEIITGLSLIGQNSLTYKAEDVKRIWNDYLDLTTSQAEQVLSAMRKASQGDNTELQDLQNLKPIFKTKGAENAFNAIRDKAFVDLQTLDNAEDIMYRSFAGYRRNVRTNEQKEKIDAIFQDLQGLYQNAISFQYAVVMREFFSYMTRYLKDDNYFTQNKILHEEKGGDITAFNLTLVSEIESILSDGLFDDVIGYMQMLERNEINPAEGYPLSELIDYYLSIHKKKIYYSEGEYVETWTPLSYIRNPRVDPELSEQKSPRFLTKSKYKDQYYTTKRMATDEDVKSDKEKATVDLNGRWLPLPKEDSPYWNKEYAKLKEGKTQQEQEAFKLLNKVTEIYFAKQMELPIGDRLDTKIPSKHIDKFEQKLFLTTQAEGVWNYVRNAVPLLGSEKAEIEEQNYLEDIGQRTVRNTDIYTGLVVNNESVKLRSKRSIPLERTSKDAISSVAMFIEDMNEFTAKTIVEPLFKSFRDVFARSHQLYPQSNKLRAQVFGDLYDTKILDKVPDSIWNNKIIAQVSKSVLTLTGMRLLGDLPGAVINLTSGEVQILIEVNISKSAAKNYAVSLGKAAKWLKQLDTDFWNQSEWGLETQMISVFNMIPSHQSISNQLSLKALYSNIRSKLMAPRSEGEKLMAIQIGLGVILSQEVVVEGKKVSVDELYELGPDGIIRLKDEYKALEKEWNPLNGTQVVLVRRAIMQFYTLLQGNYFDINRSHMSYYAAGKWAEALKKWFASNFIRRMHGRVPDPFLQRERIGHHFALGSLIGNIAQAAWNRDPKAVRDYWNSIARSPEEMLALRRSMAEFIYTALFGLLVLFGFGYDYDDKDKNKKLREMAYMKQLLLLVLMRVQGEIGTFIPLPMWGLGYMEIKRAIMDPIGLPKSTVDNLAGIGKLAVLHLFDALGMDYSRELYYQNRKGYGYNVWGLGAFKDKGDSKLFAMLLNTVGYTGYTFEPAVYMQTYNQMQNRIK